MNYYSSEMISRVRKIDLLTYLENFEPDELVPYSRGTYCTKTHDSLKISNGKWYWFSKGIGGYSALDYLIKVKELSFLEAMERLTDKELTKSDNEFLFQQQKIARLILPEKNKDNIKITSYLLNRGISQEVIDYCIDNDLIYESYPHHNVVFVGIDEKNNPRYAGIRGTSETRFMQDASGSDKEYSFRLVAQKKSDRVHVFESSIDLLSYVTLMNMSNKNWKNENFIALAGVYQPSKNIDESKIPIALNSFLRKNKSIKTIFLHFDSDKTGVQATQILKNKLNDSYEVIDGTPYIGKDWNDFLIAVLNKKEKNIESR